MVEAQRDMRDDALRQFQKGRKIIGLLMQHSPENATLPKDIIWFDDQIALLLQDS